MYLIYKSYYDGDFDTQATFYILGLYDTEEQAKKVIEKRVQCPIYKNR